MRQRVEFTVDESMPPRGDVLRAAGDGRADRPCRRASSTLLDAVDSGVRNLAEPPGLVEDISADEFAAVYAGDGRNAHDDAARADLPAGRRARPVRGDGRRACQREDLANCSPSATWRAASCSTPWRRRRPTGSPTGSAERHRERARLDAMRVLGYSPGYCGWHVSGQRALFERLPPGGDRRSRSTTSFLMQPLKSVSGVLVAGAGRDSQVPAGRISFCEAATQTVPPRMRRCGERSGLRARLEAAARARERGGEIRWTSWRRLPEQLELGDEERVHGLVGQAIDAGLPAAEILNHGLIAGMNVVGETVPACATSSCPTCCWRRAPCTPGIDLVKPLLLRDDIPTPGTVVLGSVRGDLHDIGKNLVGIMLKGAGFEVVDLGARRSRRTRSSMPR